MDSREDRRRAAPDRMVEIRVDGPSGGKAVRVDRPKPHFTSRPRVIRVLSFVFAVLFHGQVAIGSFVLWTFFVITCWFATPCGENPFRFRYANPYTLGNRSDGEEEYGEDHVVTIRMRPWRRWPELEWTDPPMWDSGQLPFREALGKPFQRERTSRSPGVFRHNEPESKAYGDSVDLVSDKPFRGKGIYDGLGAEKGGGGRYGTPPGGKDSVHLALGWLIRHQNPDGSWSAGRRMARCKVSPRGECPQGDGREDLDAGVTGLATLAFLGAGYTIETKDAWDGIAFRDVISKALSWMIKNQDSEGCIGPRGAPPPNHCLAALALCEAHGIGKAMLIPDEARKAVAHAATVVDAGGGWRLPGAGPGKDPWWIGWAVMTIKSAALSGMEVPPKAHERARRWYEDAANTGFLLTPEIWGGDGGNLHRWYFSAQALSPYDGDGGMLWRRMGVRIRKVVEAGQNREEASCRQGSWEPKDLSEREGGPVYATALRAVFLELCPPYCYTLGNPEW